ncbi:MAG: lamin tail domain-containing protein [Ferruginibacter sp.]|nr:lamin tail domain-containing protein [Ferruginibacter sp.]
MKTKAQLYLSLLLLVSGMGKAQLTENFSDGNFSSNPSWIGSTADWTVNPSFQLQSNNTVANSSYYLATASTLAISAQWEMYISLSFNTSSANYADIFLTASASDLSATATSGYFVRIGNTDDEISLYRKSSTGAITKIIDGANGVTATSNNTLKIKLTRDAASNWTLYRDITATGNTYFAEGSVTDATFNSSSFFGILVKQSTASFFQRHFFDDIEVRPYTPDITPPAIQSATALSATTVDVLFNEPLDNNSSQVALNYVASNSLGVPANAVLDAGNAALVHLTFAGNFTSGLSYQLSVNGVKDLAGNGIVNGTATFVYIAPYTARQYDVVIDEIMADPFPQVGLPNNEWIELKNTAASPINLLGWRIGDATGQTGALPAFTLLPDSFVIVCSGAAVTAMAAFGATIAVTGFPSLDNTADQLYLKSPQNNIIHSVSYTDNWYQNPLKKEGGWTLEMVDTRNPCSGFSNWKASTDTRGGSPGKKNAADAVNADANAPRLLRAYTTDSLTIILIFDEPLDSLKAATVNNFSISDGIGMPVSTVAVSPSFDKVALKLNSPLLRNKVYTVTVASVPDCAGNVIGNKNTARVGLPEVAAVADIVINEVLFNPPPAGTDYVEIYNRSNKIIDLKQTYIANRNSSGAISSIAQLSADSYFLFPQDFILVTENVALVKAAYIAQNPEAFMEISSMPVFNDDKSTVVILNAQGDVTDELSYTEKWHFKLIDNPEGVALERIDYHGPTQSENNWHSAATAAGYGTPTYKNSQYRINDGLQGELKLSPEIISPDNDGQDDFATLDYSFKEPGYVANITIFDASGRPVRYLQRNALCGTKGSFLWDGLGEKKQQLATGVYIVFTEVFNLKGKKKQFKTPVVVARRN